MVDEGRVARILRGLDERVGRLDNARTTPEEDRGDLWLDGVKYLLITSVEGCIDVAHHIVTSESMGAPATNADTFRQLARAAVIDDQLGQTLAQAVGFRNVLVHRYREVDDQVVLGVLDRLDDYRSFITQISEWMLTQR